MDSMSIKCCNGCPCFIFWFHVLNSQNRNIWLITTRRVRQPNGGRRNAATDYAIRKCAFSPNCWGTGGGWGVGWKWAPIGGLQYQTHMQAPKYDVQFLRSEALRSSSSSSSRTRQIKECKIVRNAVKTYGIVYITICFRRWSEFLTVYTSSFV